MAGLPDLRAPHEHACHRFVGYVQRIRPEQWHTVTPCSEWDVRALVDHVVRWNLFVPEFLAGRSIADMADPFTREVLGDDPAASATRSAQQAIAAFNASGALEALVHHPYGEMPGAQVLYLRLFDNTIHGWDLAHALGIDHPIDPEVAGLLYAVSDSQREAIRASGAFGPEIAVPPDADVQSRLLGLLGRQA
ncbi:MAG TPA: TIGR03086 family metal-binding protein [Chloroflexota bacterium]|nr:TIGR03086 family metal-binding protein [Chloroflexota bacterium]